MTCAAMPHYALRCSGAALDFPRWPSCVSPSASVRTRAVFSWIEAFCSARFRWSRTGSVVRGRGHHRSTRVSRVMTCHGRTGSTCSETHLESMPSSPTRLPGHAQHRRSRANGRRAASSRPTTSTPLAWHPILGRGFASGEDMGRNAHPVTVISYQTWHEQVSPATPRSSANTNAERVSFHDCRVAPEGFMARCRLCVSVLGARVDASTVQHGKLQARGSRRGGGSKGSCDLQPCAIVTGCSRTNLRSTRGAILELVISRAELCFASTRAPKLKRITDERAIKPFGPPRQS